MLPDFKKESLMKNKDNFSKKQDTIKTDLDKKSEVEIEAEDLDIELIAIAVAKAVQIKNKDLLDITDLMALLGCFEEDVEEFLLTYDIDKIQISKKHWVVFKVDVLEAIGLL